MKRRDFLARAAVSAASVVGLTGQGAQAPAPGGRQGGAGGQGGGGAARPRSGAGRASEARACFADDAELQCVPEESEQPESDARTDAHAIRPAEDVRRDVRRPQHRVSAHDDRPVGNRSGVHQGAEGEARREPVDDDPDQPGVRHRAVDLLRRSVRDVSRRSIT